MNTQSASLTSSQSINNAIASHDIKRGISMSDKAQDLAEAYATPKSLLVALSENECFSDAIMLLSHTMPHQKGLQWALKCNQHNTHSQDSIDTLQAAEKWLNEPTETNREKILPSKTVAQPNAATWLAMAAYWSGGSIADNTTPEATPTDTTTPDGLVNDTIYSSVMLSVQEVERKNQLNAYNDAINQGIKLL